MQKRTAHKEFYDPFGHYSRGVLYADETGDFTFVAYRVPYQELNGKCWKSERAFQADYRRMVARKYVLAEAGSKNSARSG